MLTITVDDQAFRDYLGQLDGRLTDMTPVMQSIGQELEARISARFETETDPGGVPWAPWKPSTRKSYPDDGNARILDRYGDMLASLNWDADTESVRVGFGQPYAVYHEFGTNRMPRRGLLFADPESSTLTDADEQLVIDVLMRWLDGA
jgi:phage virion morphogenesis protein